MDAVRKVINEYGMFDSLLRHEAAQDLLRQEDATNSLYTHSQGQKKFKDLRQVMKEVETTLAPLMKSKKRKEYEKNFKEIAEAMRPIVNESTGAGLTVIADELMKENKHYAAVPILHLTGKALLQISATGLNWNDHIHAIHMAVYFLGDNFKSHLSITDISTMKEIVNSFYFPAFDDILSGIFQLPKQYSHRLLCAAAVCCEGMGDIFQAVHLNQKALSCFRQGVFLMEQPEIIVAKNYKIYGLIKHAIGSVLLDMGCIAEAKCSALEGRLALEAATDWEDDVQKAHVMQKNLLLLTFISRAH